MVGVDKGKITYVGPQTAVKIPSDVRLIDVHGGNIIPGLIDIHFHGCSGLGLGQLNTVESELSQMSVDLPRWATTGFLIAPLNSSHKQRVAYYQRIAAFCKTKSPGAELLGIHMEGPYISPKKPGAIQPSMIHPANHQEAREIIAVSNGFLKIVSMAPEIPNAHNLTDIFLQAGIKLSIGHSNANYEQAIAAFDRGFSQVTHCFNAMIGLHHRRPGIVGALFDSEMACAELVVDGIHVHPAVIRLVYRMLSAERVIGITDAMPAAGLHEARYNWGDLQISIKDGKATLPDGTIAGSTATMDRILANLQQFTGCSLHEAVVMCSTNPARQLGLAEVKGCLVPGFDADLAVLNDRGKPILTMVGGEIVWQNNEGV